MYKTLTYLLLVLVAIACTPQQQSVVETSTKKTVLDDSNKPLADIGELYRISEDSIITYDNSALSLFVKGKFVKTLGRKGKGDTEYSTVTSLTINGDTILVLDAPNNKILLYSLSTNNCIQEILHHQFATMRVARVHKDTLYLLNTLYSIKSNPQQALLFKMSLQDSTVQPITLNIAMLDIHDAFRSSIRIKSSHNLVVQNNILYFFLPLSSKVWQYHIDSGTITSFNITLSMPKEKEMKTFSRPQDMLKLLNTMELVFSLFATNNHICVVTKLGNPPNTIWSSKFYSYTGQYVGSLQYSQNSEFIVNVNNTSIMLLGVDTNKTAQHPYYIIEHSYSSTL